MIGLFSNISPNPRDTEILEGKLNFNKGNYDGIIAIGGGSGMDGGKAISLVANNDYDIWDALLDTSTLLRNNNTSNSSSSSGTNCRIVPKAWGADMVCR